MKPVNERILSEIEKIQLVDTHEHIMPESERNGCALDFSYLFGHCNSSDLISAGMPPPLMEAFRLPIHRYRTAYIKRTKFRRHLPEPASEDMSLEERWRAVEPYWEAMRNTAYAKVTLLAVKALFGIDDLNKNTYQNLSRAIAESRQPGWYRYVMKEKAGIENSILDIMAIDVDREMFSPIQRMDNFIDIRSRQELGHLEAEAGTAIHCLDDLVKAMQIVLEILPMYMRTCAGSTLYRRKIGRRLLHELIETVPGNKIMAWAKRMGLRKKVGVIFYYRYLKSEPSVDLSGISQIFR